VNENLPDSFEVVVAPACAPSSRLTVAPVICLNAVSYTKPFKAGCDGGLGCGAGDGEGAIGVEEEWGPQPRATITDKNEIVRSNCMESSPHGR
jgi:hypothetical protein